MPRIDDSEFCVIDFETTGLSASRGGRAVELGMVRVDARGRELGRFCSLFRANGKPGPTRVHKITAAHLKDAPKFEEVVGDILELLDGAIVVAHNVSFDAGFLRAECLRAGIEPPDFRRLCTVRLTRKRFPGYPSYSLGRITRSLGITLTDAHTALADTVATSRLLTLGLQQARDEGEVDLWPLGVRGRSVRWPSRPSLRAAWTRAQAEAGETPQFAAGTLFAGMDDHHGKSASGGPATERAKVQVAESSQDSTLYIRLIDRLLTGNADLPTMRRSLDGFSGVVDLPQPHRDVIHAEYLAQLSGAKRDRAAVLFGLDPSVAG